MFWYQKQLRMLQTVLREIDIIDYQADQVVAYLQNNHYNSIIINGGGVIDFFDNPLPMARLNDFQNSQDILKDLIDLCHKNSIKVMARVDFRGAEKERFVQHPDWFGKNQDGTTDIGWNRIYRPCYNSFYANGHAQAYIRNLMQTYDLDGIWENSVGFGQTACYCKTCRDQYLAETGNTIPDTQDFLAPAFDDYRRWKALCADRHIAGLRAVTKSFGDDKAFCAEIFGMFHRNNAVRTGIDLYNAKKHFDFLVSPAFQDGSPDPSNKYDVLTYASSSMKFLRSIEPAKQTVLLYGNNGTKWRYIKSPSAETRIWLWEAAAVGAGFWNCLFNGQHPGAAVDRRNAGIEKDVMEYLEMHQDRLEGQAPVSDVGILYSKSSRDRFGDDLLSNDEYAGFVRGAERVLNEHHLQYTFVPDLDLTLEKLADCKVIVLPNDACLSDDQLSLLRQYVQQGGGLVASYKSSLYDESGNQRADFGLRDLFGVSYTGVTIDTELDCYQLVRDAGHELLKGMNADQTAMLMNSGKTLLCTLDPDSTSHTVLTYVPQIFNQPPEYAWIAQTQTEYPTAVVNTFGKGKVVYFANQPDKLSGQNGHEDFTLLYKNAVVLAAQSSMTIAANVPASVNVHLQKKGNKEYILSLVNTTSSTLRPVQEIIPVRRLSLSIPDARLEQFEILKQDGAIDVTHETKGGQHFIQISIDRLQEFCAVHLTLQ